MKNVLFIFAFLLILANCDEIDKIFNPSSDEYLIDKTISVSTTEQVVESDPEFKMIFPANSISGDLTLKIKKEGSYPAFNIPNTKLGSNSYRIKFSGNTAFASPVKIIINYDKSQIPAGKTAAEIIQAYIYANDNWKLATYQLDEPNGKIIISISNLETPKINKDIPELQGEGEIIIGDGYTSTDTGNNDNPLAVANLFYVKFTSNSQSYGRTILVNQFYKPSSQTTDIVKLTFSGNSFSASYDSAPGVDPETINPEQTLEFNYSKFSLSGEIDNNNYKKIKRFVISESRNYSAAGWAEAWYDEKATLSINDLDLSYESKNKDTLVYEIKEASKSPDIQSFSWLFDDKWNNKQYSQGKADLTGLILKFTK